MIKMFESCWSVRVCIAQICKLHFLCFWIKKWSFIPSAPVIGKKRKQDGSSSSQSSDELQPSKKRKWSEVRLLIQPFLSERAKAISPVHVIFAPFLGQKAYNDNDDENSGPSWEMRETMVRKLQKKFPDQDKEVNITFVIHLFCL